MKKNTLNFLIAIGSLALTIFVYFLRPPLLLLIIIILVFALTGYLFIYKHPQLQEKIPLHSSAFSSLAKKFLYPKLIFLTMVIPVVASELGEILIIYILGITLAIIILILLLFEIQKSPNVKKLFFWILLSIVVLAMNVDFFYMRKH